MADHSNENTSSESTTWAWRQVKIKPHARAKTAQRAAGAPSSPRRRRNRREPLSVTIVYRGGPECWYELRARGIVIRRPGVVALHDALLALEGTDYSEPI